MRKAVALGLKARAARGALAGLGLSGAALEPTASARKFRRAWRRAAGIKTDSEGAIAAWWRRRKAAIAALKAKERAA